MAKNLAGKKCPVFKAEATNDEVISNSTYKGKNLVIYFYPKDNTPGCTTEGQEFRDAYKKFKKLNTEILGVSRDPIRSHENFKSKQNFPFELLSDPDEKVCKAFAVMKLPPAVQFVDSPYPAMSSSVFISTKVHAQSRSGTPGISARTT